MKETVELQEVADFAKSVILSERIKGDEPRRTLVELGDFVRNSIMAQFSVRVPRSVAAASPDALSALRNIAEGNLGDAPWQADYKKIRTLAREALARAEGKGA